MAVRAVLLAVAAEPVAPGRDLWKPMLRWLYDLPAEEMGQAIRALGRFEDPDLLARLRDTAIDPEQPLERRGRAIAAMGEWRWRSVAQVLIELTAAAQPAAVQASAYGALENLTGIARFGEDRGAWASWWERSRRLDALEWNRQLVRNFARRRAAVLATDEQLAQKLRDAEQALYQASTPTEQAASLVTMLQNPLEATRLLAADLAQARLVQGLEFAEPLRVALRARLGDESAEVRRRAAEVLRDLNDAPAADVVAQRLIDGVEQVNRVLVADLQLLTEMPRKRATEAVLALLGEPGLKADAADALAALARGAGC